MTPPDSNGLVRAVKALEWVAGDGKYRSEDSYQADDGFGGYYFVIERQWRHWTAQNYGDAGSDELAQAAAQSHHTAAILAAIDPVWLARMEAWGERRGIYIASKAAHGARWAEYRNANVPIISTWIDESGVGETVDWSGLWSRCISEASRAAVLVAYREPGEVLKGAFIEIGAALANGIPVILCGDFAGFSFLHHPLVTCTDEPIRALLTRLAAQEQQT